MPDITETADATASAATAYTLGLGQIARGTLATASDHDYWRVNLTAGQQYTIALVGVGATPVRDTFLQVFAANGSTSLFTDDDGLSSNNSGLTFTAAATGSYYIDAGSFQNQSSGDYQLIVATGTRPSFDTDMAVGVINSGSSWATVGNVTNVTWGVRQSPATYTVDGSNIATFSQLTAAQTATVQAVLANYSEIANITFQQINPGGTTNNATMLFANYLDATDGSAAFAYFPGSTAAAAEPGDVWINRQSFNVLSQPLGSYDYHTILHEVGHALGLSHPGKYEAFAGQPVTYANSADFVQDSNQYTVMSYFDADETGAVVSGSADTPLLFDIAALQLKYGANFATRAGSTIYGFGGNAGAVYDFAVNTTPAFAIWDGGGIDLINASGYSTAQRINLNAGSFSNLGSGVANVAIAFNVTIENATGGSAGDTLIGNAVANFLRGGAGADSIDGGAGDDNLEGGTGGDSLNGGANFDFVRYDNEAGAIFVSLANAALNGGAAAGDAFTSIEGVIGSGFGDTIYGNGEINTLSGAGGADFLIGAGGNDSLFGGDADDNLDGGAGSDTLNGGAGFDFARYENEGTGIVVSLANSAFSGGAATGDVLTEIEGVVGSNFSDTIYGNGEINTLSGAGGADFLIGAGGNDSLFAGDGDDNLEGGAGSDTLHGGAGFDFARYENEGAGIVVSLANSAFSGGAATGDVLIEMDGVIGSNLVDTIYGDTAANTLAGAGGGDFLIGGGGNDSLFAGDGDDNLDGGAGSDTLNGGAGFDFARYDSETTGITASLANAALNAGAAAGDVLVEIEGIVGTAFADTLTGDGAGNTLSSAGGHDRLDGAAGNDFLIGGAGNDTFVFAAGAGHDTVADFSAGAGAGDILSIAFGPAYDSLAEIMAVAVQLGADTILAFDSGNSVTLRNLLATALVQDDFLFVA